MKTKPDKKPGRITARKDRAKQAAVKAAAPSVAVLLAGAAAQAGHAPLHLCDLPYAYMAGASLMSLRVRDLYEAAHVRRHGGRRAARKRRKYQGPASAREVHRKLSVQAARKRAKVTRPMYGGQTRRLPVAEAGVVIGKGGTPERTVMGTHEDFYLMFAPPRSGKTAWLSGVVLDAPGAVLTTSTRVDVYAHTVVPRSASGPVSVLNPGGDGGIPTNLAWSPLQDCHHPAGAIEAAGYLMNAAPKDAGGKDAWWDARGHELLRIMMHAAALGGATMREVAAWVRDPASTEPMAILTEMPDAADGWAAELTAICATEEQQLHGITASASAALSWMADPALAAIACPEGEEFDAWEFLLSCGTVYLIGTDRPHNSLAPYFAAFTAHLFDTAKRLASVSQGSRLDPPLTLVIDEPAVTCPVPLDRWSAEAGGHGITLVTGIQSPAQLAARWGEHGARTIRDNASVTLVFGGYNNHAELDALSAVCGSRDTYDSVKGPDGKTSRQPRTERLYPPERLRTLPAWQAVLLHRAARPVQVTITPVWDRDGYQRYEAARIPVAEAVPAIEAPRREAIPMPGAPALTSDPAIHALPDLTRSPQWQEVPAPTSR